MANNMSDAPHKKHGSRSNFQGKRTAFLEDFWPIYLKASKEGLTRTIWDKFFVSYWEAFPWRLPLEKGPDPTDPIDYALKPENPDEVEKKAKLIPATEAVHTFDLELDFEDLTIAIRK
jgi:hypothetical protein